MRFLASPDASAAAARGGFSVSIGSPSD